MRFKLSQLWQTQQHFHIDLLTARHQVNTPGWSTVLLQASTPASSNGKTTSAHNKQAVRTHQLLLCSTSTLLCYQTLSSTSVINAMSTKRTAMRHQTKNQTNSSEPTAHGQTLINVIQSRSRPQQSHNRWPTHRCKRSNLSEPPRHKSVECKTRRKGPTSKPTTD